jgi:hypothetical protein
MLEDGRSRKHEIRNTYYEVFGGGVISATSPVTSGLQNLLHESSVLSKQLCEKSSTCTFISL